MLDRINRVGLAERAWGRLAPVQAAMLAQQERAATRFAGRHDWLRLAILGVIVLHMAALSLVRLVSEWRTPDDTLAYPAVFGGMMLCIGLVRIGRPAFLLDWFLSGLCYIGLGFILSIDPALASPALFGLFCVLFVASALLRLWIGVTTCDATGWLVTSGLTGLFCAGWPVLTRLTGPALDMQLVLAVDLLVYGLSISGFALSLRGSR